MSELLQCSDKIKQIDNLDVHRISKQWYGGNAISIFWTKTNVPGTLSALGERQ